MSLIDNILTELERIRDERGTHANTATRVGTALIDLLSLISGIGNSKLSKTDDDTASGEIGFQKGLWVKTANGASKVIELLTSGLAKVKSLLVNGTWGIDDDGDATLHDVAANDVTARDATMRDVTGRDAEFENLTVTKEAHFFKLVVDELLSNKGAIIISSANCVVEAVQQDQSTYTVYFSNTDKDGIAVNNPWVVGDHALCLTFNGEGAGTFSDVKNRYYWRKVVGVYSDITYEGKTYHAISLSKTDGEGSTVPAAGDSIVQLGYSGQTSIPARQTAIILSAYQTMDTGDSNANIRGLVPPSFAFYKGINDFSLSSHRYTYMDGVANEFFGDFKVLANGSYTDLTTILATMDGVVSTVSKTVRGKNIISSDGWTDFNGNLLGADNYNEATQMLTNGSTHEDVVWSPIFFLPAGTYTFSCYSSSSDIELYVYDSNKRKDVPNSFNDSTSYYINNSQSGDSYQEVGRKYVSFTLDNDAYVCLNLYIEDSQFTVYRPMLESGSSVSDWESGVITKTSQIKQTADSIDLGVRSDLGTVGININGNNKTVNLIAGKVNFVDPSGNAYAVPKISIDPITGTLKAVDGQFEGTVKANNLYHGICFLSAEGNINYLWYCKPASVYGNNSYSYINYGASYINNFTEEKYYTTEEILEGSKDEQTGESLIQAPDDSGFLLCTGYSDLIYVLPDVANNFPDVFLPRPEDVQGKEVEVCGFYHGMPSPIPSFYVKCVENPDGKRMTNLLYYDEGILKADAPTNHIAVSAGESKRFVSVRATNGTWYWLAISMRINQEIHSSVSWSDVTSKPTTIAGYGITDAKIVGTTITLGNNTITPLTSFTESDPTVPSWAKQSSKPSYQFSEIGGSVAASQLPTLYWANVAISNQSNNNTSPQFGELRLRPGSNNYGSYLYFGDYSYCYLQEDSDDHLKIYGSHGVEITTDSGYDLTWGGYTLATQAWVGQQGYITSSAISDMATKTWVDSQSFVTESAFSGMLENEAYINNGTIYIGGNSITPLTQHQSLSGCAQIGAHNNLTASGNEFTCAASGQSGTYYINYRTAGGSNGSITEYRFCDGAGNTLAEISNGQFSGNAASATKALKVVQGNKDRLVTTANGVTVVGDNNNSTIKFSTDGSAHYEPYIMIRKTLDGNNSAEFHLDYYTANGGHHFKDATSSYADVYAKSFVANGSSNDYVLLGGGGTKTLTDFIRKNINGSQGDLELGTLYLNAEDGLFLQENIGDTDYNVNIWVGSGNNSHTCHFDNSYNDFDGYKFDAGIETAGGLTINDTLVINRDDRTMKITPANSGYFTNTVAYTLYDNSGNALNSANHYFTGNIVASGSITQSSDIRKKDVSEYLEPSVYDMAQAPIVKFRWKGGTSGREHVGTVAQYWREVVPQIVGETPDGMLTMDYATAGVVAGVTAARKAVELERRIEEQDRRIEELEQIINQLKGN